MLGRAIMLVIATYDTHGTGDLPMQHLLNQRDFDACRTTIFGGPLHAYLPYQQCRAISSPRSPSRVCTEPGIAR